MTANTILVFSEKPALQAELLAKARQQADGLGWSVAALTLGADGAALGKLGADVVYQCDADQRHPEQATAALAAAVGQGQPALCLIGATKTGMEVAPRVAERAGCGYAAWAVGFEVEAASGAITARCMVYTGTGIATYQFKPGPVILTVGAGVFAATAVEAKAVAATCLPAPATPSAMTILEYKPKPASGERLEEAHLVVDVGQGFKQREDLSLARAAADALDGKLACSRPIASDRDWFPEWLGLSGTKIKPDLCLTIGVSGAIQHIVGIRDSHLIAAVNSDEGAPIFAQADYGVVADLYEFLPALIERLKARGVQPAWKA